MYLVYEGIFIMNYTFIDDGSYFTLYIDGKRTQSKLNYNIYNNELKIEDICSDSNLPHTGTELIIQFLKQHKQNHIIFSRIYGRLSSADAKQGNWNNSISFFKNLPTYIQSEISLSYEFHLYYDNKRNIEITSCYDKEECTALLISEHSYTNSDMVFDLFLI